MSWEVDSDSSRSDRADHHIRGDNGNSYRYGIHYRVPTGPYAVSFRKRRSGDVRQQQSSLKETPKMNMLAEAWHWLIVLHHGSHYDYRIWAQYVNDTFKHPFLKPWTAAERVRQILLKDPQLGE
jgi:hypothetical protein